MGREIKKSVVVGKKEELREQERVRDRSHSRSRSREKKK
jgi:hypothetical protein